MSDTPHAQSAEVEVHRADPGEKRRTLWICSLALVSGALLLMALQHELGQIEIRLQTGDANLAADRFVWLARAAFALLGLVGVITAFLVAKGARAVIREQRYPHSRARLVRDRVVTRGKKAVLFGRIGFALALGFASVGCAGAIYGWRLVGALLG